MRNRDGSPAECDGSYLLSSMNHCIEDIKHSAAGEAESDALTNKLLRRDQLLQTIASGRAFAEFIRGG
ncbi:hypothetical protein ACHAWF_005795 [Thalassiosira exigua]